MRTRWLLALLTFIAACSGPATPTTEELCDDLESFEGQRIATADGPSWLRNSCTESVCSDDQPCCNSCQYTVGWECTTIDVVVVDEGQAVGCTSDECNPCPDIAVEDYEGVSGVLRHEDSLGRYSLQVD